MDLMRPIRTFICTSCRATKTQPRSWIRPPYHRAIFSTAKLAASSSSASSFSDNLSKSLDNLMSTPNNQRRSAPGSTPRPSSNAYTDYLNSETSTVPPDAYESLGSAPKVAAHRLNIYCTKRNTHLTLSAPPEKKPEGSAVAAAPTYRVLLSLSAGHLGFRKAGRGSYDASFQLAAFTFKKIHERALLRGDAKVELTLRGFSQGREAVTKALMGQEGRMIRPKIISVTDATRTKIGGSRSPRPRRLG